MEKSTEIILGGVYKELEGVYKNHLRRILLFDDIEVFFDAWHENSQSWHASNLQRTIYYYRTPLKVFLKSSELMRIETLNETEINVHRPDLPLRLCLFSTISWTKRKYPSKKAFISSLDNSKIGPSDKQTLNTPKVVLVPYGPKGGNKRASILIAQNGKYFTYTDLIWHAHNLQSSFMGEASDGIGLYRLGIQKGLPSYCIDDYNKQARMPPPPPPK